LKQKIREIDLWSRSPFEKSRSERPQPRMGHSTSKVIRSDHFWNNFSTTVKRALARKTHGSARLFQFWCHIEVFDG
jgi:hypothetical protein